MEWNIDGNPGSGSTLEELADGLPGTPFETSPLPVHRDSEIFEALRNRAEAFSVPPSVYLANIGRTSDWTARASFARNLFAAGGFSSLDGDAAIGAASILAEAEANGCRFICLCGSDSGYGECGGDLASALAALGARVILAGRPSSIGAGGDGLFASVALGCNAAGILDSMLSEVER